MLNEEIKQQLQSTIKGTIQFDEPMSRLTTIRIGGPADAIVYPENVEELQNLMKLALEQKLPVFIFGWGSNLLVRDGGIRGLVINLSRAFNEIKIVAEDEQSATIEVAAGVKIPALLDFMVKNNLAGMEYMAGIPATVGGAIWMNAGTPKGEIGNHVEAVTIVSKTGRVRSIEKKACGFSYRSSKLPAGSVVIGATLKLEKGVGDKIKTIIDKHKAHRIETQPLNVPNLGSVFKNPKKNHAGRLVEEAGLKDVRVGQARISEKHGNFIVNEGKASATDVLSLIGLVKDKVKEKFKVTLETEVKVVGTD